MAFASPHIRPYQLHHLVAGFKGTVLNIINGDRFPGHGKVAISAVFYPGHNLLLTINKK
jgi:hypothetical protein